MLLVMVDTTRIPPPRPVFRSRLTSLIAGGPSWRERRRCGGPGELELYYEAGDPHSHLCAQLLPELQRRLAIPIVVRVVPPPDEAAYPETARQRRFALQDALQIAPAWGLDFAGHSLPDPADCQRAARTLVAARSADDFAQRERVCAEALFTRSDIRTAVRGFAAQDDRSTGREIVANGRMRTQRGHYLPAMWQYNGEWFWALDRIDLLEARLRAQGLLQGQAPLVEFRAEQARLPAVAADAPVRFWFSFRSPYSWLAAMRIRQRPELFSRLQVCPVLPMAMRGLPVPKAKRYYIVRDAARLARQYNFPFGRIADPLGAGAERCLGVFPLADGVAQQLDFLCSAGQAVWGEGIDVATAAGMRFVVERAGLDWRRAEAMLRPPLDFAYAERNREALFAAGLWGVPSFGVEDFATWGQDRLWMIEEIVAKSASAAA